MGGLADQQDSTEKDFIPDTDSGNFGERVGVYMNERHDKFKEE